MVVNTGSKADQHVGSKQRLSPSGKLYPSHTQTPQGSGITAEKGAASEPEDVDDHRETSSGHSTTAALWTHNDCNSMYRTCARSKPSMEGEVGHATSPLAVKQMATVRYWRGGASLLREHLLESWPCSRGRPHSQEHLGSTNWSSRGLFYFL